MLLKIFSFATLLVICAASVNKQQDNKMLRSADQNLLQFMLRSGPLTQGNPQRSLACFDYYVPLLNSITEEYKVNYQRCLDEAADSRDQIDGLTQPDRDNIESAASNACENLNSCQENQNSIDYFECYANTAGDNSKILYSISANSSEILAQVREDYRLIDVEENRCTNKSERVYVEETAAAYEELQSCIQGKTPVPTDPPSTPPSTEPPETEAPETEAPETEAPETEAPETEAPETEAPETDPPAESTKPAESTEPAESTPPAETEAPEDIPNISSRR